MKAKNFLIISAFIIFFTFFSTISKAQDEMDFEEFMGVMSENMTEAQMGELSDQLPWNIKVYGYGHGDFSADGKEDIILSIREKDVTPKNTVDVYVFENIEDSSYKLISKQNYHYYELTLEVAFLVKDGVCHITHRDNNNWYFTSYIINGDDELAQIDEELFPINPENAGK